MRRGEIRRPEAGTRRVAEAGSRTLSILRRLEAKWLVIRDRISPPPLVSYMKHISHEEQQKIWDAEHGEPYVLKQMHSDDASSGVIKFWDFLRSPGHVTNRALEMGCGKGRNVMWLAQQGVDAYGFDFSPTAITEADKRASKLNLSRATHFAVQDATIPWQYETDFFDFGIDCFATTDIETAEGRKKAIQEMHRVLKPNGYLLAYLLSTEDAFHKEMITKSPTKERNAFLHPTGGKFEKTYDEQDIEDTFKGFTIVKKERVRKKTEFFGKEYACLHHWIVFQKAYNVS